MIEADFGDGSALTITAMSGTDDAVQVDLIGDGVAISFADERAFAPRAYGITLF